MWALVRGCIAAGGWQRRLAETLHSALCPGPADAPIPGQRALWVVDSPGLPPRPWRILPETRFNCHTLGCDGMEARTCVLRQLSTDAQRTEQASRGQGTDFPSCDSRKCAQGRGIREALYDPEGAVRWRGVGPGGRFDVSRGGSGASRRRHEREGLLDAVRILDLDPDPVTED